jgi:E1A-binding protein p400
MEEKRKKVMDEQLSFIVDQTEKFSMWLTEGLAPSGIGSHSAVSQTSRTASQSPTDGVYSH